MNNFLNFIKKKKTYLIAFLGAINVFAFAPFNFWFLVFISTGCFYYFLEKEKSPKKAFFLGFYYGFFKFIISLSWINQSLYEFGGIPLVFSFFLISILISYLALYPALVAYFFKRFQTNNHLKNIFLFSSLWLIFELLRGTFLTGFSWFMLGYSQLDSPFGSIAPFFGAEGITFIVVFFSALFCKVLQLRFQNKLTKNNKKQLIIPFFIVIFLVFITNIISFTKKTTQKVNVALVQGNIEQELRWDLIEQNNIIKKYFRLEKTIKDAQIIIWPEAALPVLEPLANNHLRFLNYISKKKNRAVITGVVDYSNESYNFYNSVIVLGKYSNENQKGYYYDNSNRYRKYNLLPIGEFVPFSNILRPIAPVFNLPMSSFSKGNYYQKNLLANGFKFATAICYEVLFPNRLRKNTNKDTDFLLTISNDAWFGTSIGPHQHNQIAKMRAKELGKPLIRATNTGITSVIDEKGQTIKALDMEKTDVLQLDVHRVTGQTLYHKIGNKVVYIFSFIIFFLVLFSSKKILILKRSKNKK